MTHSVVAHRTCVITKEDVYKILDTLAQRSTTQSHIDVKSSPFDIAKECFSLCVSGGLVSYAQGDQISDWLEATGIRLPTHNAHFNGNLLEPAFSSARSEE